MQQRALSIAPVLASLFAAVATASPIDPGETFVLPADRIVFGSGGSVPPHSSEMAPFYGDPDPQHAVPVAARGFVLRRARTWGYDGLWATGREPAVIAVFGIGPVDIRLADPKKPSWRHI